MSCGRLFPFLLPAIFISPVSRIEKIQSTILFIYVKFSPIIEYSLPKTIKYPDSFILFPDLLIVKSF